MKQKPITRNAEYTKYLFESQFKTAKFNLCNLLNAKEVITAAAPCGCQHTVRKGLYKGIRADFMKLLPELIQTHEYFDAVYGELHCEPEEALTKGCDECWDIPSRWYFTDWCF
jgi:hypothetical protein